MVEIPLDGADLIGEFQSGVNELLVPPRPLHVVHRLINTLRNADGYTLVEVLVAAAILGIVGTGLIGGIVTLTRVSDIVERRTMALSVARHQIERVKGIDYATDPTVYLTAIPASVVYSGRAYDAPVYATPGPTPGLQRLIVPVSFQGELILAMEEVKIDRNAPTPVPTPTPIP